VVSFAVLVYRPSATLAIDISLRLSLGRIGKYLVLSVTLLTSCTFKPKEVDDLLKD
jgi:hypothetical protein